MDDDHTGCLVARQRGRGSWEVRVSLNADPVSGRSVYRSVTVHGELAEAERAGRCWRRRPSSSGAGGSARCGPSPTCRSCGWRLSTTGRRRPGRATGTPPRRLSADPLARRAPATVSPPVLRAAMRSWQQAGVLTTTTALHVRMLKAALGWAFERPLLGAAAVGSLLSDGAGWHQANGSR